MERTNVWPELTIQCDPQQIILSWPDRMWTAGSSLLGGGNRRSRHIVNRCVDGSYNPSNPESEMRRYIRSLGLAINETTTMMTAVDLRDTVGVQVQHHDFAIFAAVTVGVRNAARSGQRYSPLYPAYHPGTINMAIVFDAAITPAALLNTYITATEAKVAALQDERIVDQCGLVATGTTTDAIVVASTNRARGANTHRYMGISTEIGNALGRAIYMATRRGIALYQLRRPQYAYGPSDSTQTTPPLS